ncbi:hypothetical protein EJ06DRAFT_520670 [Trichodelitschia bisporula]|uniref:Uncharacterized protein n=1 Tax=Trichodelitschia bisporula TaxID=703511 RepID=A0A6G1I0U0_9PEZI|nr:hypothetical protein EJ06DRAFT_520670 [Trichodelitschia bisporula]
MAPDEISGKVKDPKFMVSTSNWTNSHLMALEIPTEAWWWGAIESTPDSTDRTGQWTPSILTLDQGGSGASPGLLLFKEHMDEVAREENRIELDKHPDERQVFTLAGWSQFCLGGYVTHWSWLPVPGLMGGRLRTCGRAEIKRILKEQGIADGRLLRHSLFEPSTPDSDGNTTSNSDEDIPKLDPLNQGNAELAEG